MRIDRSGIAAVVLQRIRRGRRRPAMSEFHLMAGAAVAVVAIMAFAGPASARPVSGTDVPPMAQERTEGERFAQNYGFGSSEETVVAVERTVRVKYANNVDRDGRLADAARLQVQADFYMALPRHPDVGLAQRTTEELSHQKALARLSLTREQPKVAIERTEGEKYAQSYGYTSADLGIAGIEPTESGKVASASSEIPANDGVPWDSIAVWTALIVLAGAVTVLDVRRHPRASI
jgi:hypothetical protein